MAKAKTLTDKVADQLVGAKNAIIETAAAAGAMVGLGASTPKKKAPKATVRKAAVKKKVAVKAKGNPAPKRAAKRAVKKKTKR